MMLKNWQTMRQACNVTDDMLAAFYNLASSVQTIRDKARAHLSVEIAYHYDPYEASFFVVPFFLKLAMQQEWPDRASIMLMLAEMGWRGPSDYSVQWAQEMMLQFWQEDNSIAQAHLLLDLSHHYLYFRPEQPPTFEEDDRLFVHLAQAEETHPLIRVVAALMHICLREELAQETVIEPLLSLLGNDKLLHEWTTLWPESLFLPRLLDYAGWTLRLLPLKMGTLVLPPLLAIIRQCEQASPTGRMSIELAHALLYFAFGGPPLAQNAFPFLLTTTKRAVLTTLLTDQGVALDALAERFALFDLPFPWKARLLLQI